MRKITRWEHGEDDVLDFERADEVQKVLVACGYEKLQDLLRELTSMQSSLPIKKIRKWIKIFYHGETIQGYYNGRAPESKETRKIQDY